MITVELLPQMPGIVAVDEYERFSDRERREFFEDLPVPLRLRNLPHIQLDHGHRPDLPSSFDYSYMCILCKLPPWSRRSQARIADRTAAN
ncbi:hypothetical protein [Nakamurella panacisegetis]|uniref:hypothetical protein n=1 Tax=Nakamurella panacisegetis TaxID=1090615 RepID=UPI001E355AEA|nr:hypothetical protein [Nakamurella panacisegetis]